MAFFSLLQTVTWFGKLVSYREALFFSLTPLRDPGCFDVCPTLLNVWPLQSQNKGKENAGGTSAFQCLSLRPHPPPVWGWHPQPIGHSESHGTSLTTRQTRETQWHCLSAVGQPKILVLKVDEELSEPLPKALWETIVSTLLLPGFSILSLTLEL